MTHPVIGLPHHRKPNTISLKCLCINRVNQVKETRVKQNKKSPSAQIQRGKGISIAVVIHSFDSRLRNKETIWLRHQMHFYSSEMV